MKVVKHKITGRLVYRELPDFEKGLGIINAVTLGLGTKDELEEVEIDEKEWEEELKLREAEEPPSLEKRLEKLEDRIKKLEEKAK